MDISYKKVVDSVNCMFDHKYKLLNSYIYSWESDYFGISKGSGYAYEVEIKMSKSDFKADFKKEQKHKILAAKNSLVRVEFYGKGFDKVFKSPNRFYYACPEGLIDKKEVPDYAGLIYVSDIGAVKIKEAPFLHKEKYNLDSVLKDKFYYAYLDMKLSVNLFKQNYIDLQYQLQIISEEEKTAKQLKLL